MGMPFVRVQDLTVNEGRFTSQTLSSSSISGAIFLPPATTESATPALPSPITSTSANAAVTPALPSPAASSSGAAAAGTPSAVHESTPQRGSYSAAVHEVPVPVIAVPHSAADSESATGHQRRLGTQPDKVSQQQYASTSSALPTPAQPTLSPVSSQQQHAPPVLLPPPRLTSVFSPPLRCLTPTVATANASHSTLGGGFTRDKGRSGDVVPLGGRGAGVLVGEGGVDADVDASPLAGNYVRTPFGFDSMEPLPLEHPSGRLMSDVTQDKRPQQQQQMRHQRLYDDDLDREYRFRDDFDVSPLELKVHRRGPSSLSGTAGGGASGGGRSYVPTRDDGDGSVPRALSHLPTLQPRDEHDAATATIAPLPTLQRRVEHAVPASAPRPYSRNARLGQQREEYIVSDDEEGEHHHKFSNTAAAAAAAAGHGREPSRRDDYHQQQPPPQQHEEAQQQRQRGDAHAAKAQRSGDALYFDDKVHPANRYLSRRPPGEHPPKSISVVLRGHH